MAQTLDWIQRRFNGLNLQTKLLFAFILIALPGLLLALFGDIFLIHQRRSQLPLANLSVAQAVGAVVDTSFDAAMATAWSVATGPSTLTLQPAVLDRRLAPLAAVDPQLSNVTVVNASGTSVGEMVPYPAGQPRVSFGDQAFFRQVMATNLPVLSGPYLDRRLGVPVVYAAVPIRGPASRPVGAVVVTMNLAYLSQRISYLQLTTGQVLLITDPNGQLVLQSDRPGLPYPTSSLAGVPLIQTVLRAGDDAQALQNEGPFDSKSGSWLGAALRTPRYHWVVAAVEPVNQVTTVLRQTLEYDAVSLVAALVLALAATYFVARRILEPLGVITQTAAAWGRGHLSERVSVSTGDELEGLAVTLNGMAASLEQAMQRLAQTDHRLTDERNRLQAILDTSPAGIVAIDHHEVVVLVNPVAAALGLVASPGRELASFPVIRTIYHPDGTPWTYDDLPLIRSLREGVSVSGAEVLIRQANGWQEHLLVNSAPIRDTAGRVVGAVSISFDVTPLAEEERLRREFVVSAAHEFRNPLTVIKGYAEIALRDPSIRGTPVQRELERILDAANRVSHLADDLLRASQLHLPTLVLHQEVIDLDALVRDAVAAAQATPTAGHYQWELHTRSAEVQGDPVLLREAVMDLLQQAETAMPTGGTIVVRVTAWDGIASVSVTDHGPIVSVENLPTMFYPYAAPGLQSTEVGPTRQTLPLYLAKRIVEESGGWIRAQSTAQGTTVTITLPRYFSSPAGSWAAPQSAPPPGSPAPSSPALPVEAGPRARATEDGRASPTDRG